MDAASFEPLAELLATSYTVLTSDPRGINRSSVDAERDVTPDERADDLAALIDHVGGGHAHVFGSSGGAVSALALLQRRGAPVRTVIAHEPPLGALLSDRDELYGRTEAMVSTYLAGDRVSAWHDFLDMADIAMPPEAFEAVFGATPEGREAADERFSFAHMEIPTTFWEPDLALLGASSSALVVAIGDESAGQLCDRTSRALAEAVGVTPTTFPGCHIGFIEDPDAFAAALRDVLDKRPA